jgi:hypothetical protein
LNREALALQADGVDIVQFDEPAFNVFLDEVNTWGIAALERAAAGLSCTTAVHICYGYGIQANIDWKNSLGDEWRQYERILPALAKSRIDQISLECIHSHVPPELMALPGVCAAEGGARVGPARGRRQGAARSPGWAPGPAAQRRMRPLAGPTRRAAAIHGAGRRCTLVVWARHTPRVRLAQRRDSPRRGPRSLPPRLLGVNSGRYGKRGRNSTGCFASGQKAQRRRSCF